MTKIGLLLIGILTSFNASAMFQYDCELWNNDDIFIEVTGILAASLGDTGKDRQVNPSTMTIIRTKTTKKKDGTYSSKDSLIFNDNISHLNVARPNGDWGAGGMFSKVETKVYPIINGKVREETIEARHLNFFVHFLPGNGLDSIEVSVQTTDPSQDVFLGSEAGVNRVVIDGKEYKDLHSKCDVAIGWEYYASLLKQKP